MKYPASHLTPFPPTFPRKSSCKRIHDAKIPTRRHASLPALCFQHLTNPSPSLIDSEAPYFHTLTNPFSRNPFTFTSIQNPRVSPPLLSISDCRLREGATFLVHALQRRKAP